jgi:alkylation response protein AidB-like acyl-CoA dehydrogenase
MWDLILSDDQAMIADSVEEFLRREQPLERLRPNASRRDREAEWAAMAELGWFGLGLAEDLGGAGLGVAEEVLIQQACGARLVSTSVLATVVAAHTAAGAGDRALAAQLAAGTRRAVLTVAAGPGETLAFDWTGDELLLVWNDSGAGLFEGGAFAGAVPDESLDDSLSLHRGRLSPEDALCRVAAGTAPIALRAEALLAARLAGLAQGACVLATEYAKVREQFGKPIGSFQAIKHRCADMHVRAQTAGFLVALAALKVAQGSPDAALQVACAKLKAADAAHENGRAAIQVHGGIGFQAECDAHWFMKRAHVYDQAGGNMQVQAARAFAAPSPLW